MKKYLKEIELSGILLMLVGVVMFRVLHLQAGYITCVLGIALWLVEVVYKAFHWQEYRKDNMQNIVMMLVVIMLLLITLAIVTR